MRKVPFFSQNNKGARVSLVTMKNTEFKNHKQKSLCQVALHFNTENTVEKDKSKLRKAEASEAEAASRRYVFSQCHFLYAMAKVKEGSISCE